MGALLYLSIISEYTVIARVRLPYQFHTSAKDRFSVSYMLWLLYSQVATQHEAKQAPEPFQ